MASRRKNSCDAESAGSGESARPASAFDPLAAPDAPVASPDTVQSVDVGLPLSHTEFRALKERARTPRTPPRSETSAAQEDGHGNEKNPGSRNR